MARPPISIAAILSLSILIATSASREFAYRTPISLLEVIPHMREAAEEYLSHKDQQKHRRLQAAEPEDASDADPIAPEDEDVIGNPEIADSDFDDDGEIFIDPSFDMPDADTWGDENAEDFLEPIKDDSSQCVRTLMDLTNNFMSYNDTVMHIFRNSGKDYNDFGRYEDCQKIHEFNYFMVTVLKKFPIPFTLGLCLPKPCQLADLNEFKPFLTKAINAALPNMFENVKGFAVAPSVAESDINILDPKVENKNVAKINAVSIVALSMIIFFVGTSIIATFFLWSKTKDALRLQRASRSMDEGGRSPHGSSAGSFASSGSGGSGGSGGPQNDDSRCGRFMRCFSAMDNVAKLSKPRAKLGDQELEVMNGLRVICCVLLILGNSYYYTLRSPIQNLEVVQDWVQSSFFSVVLSADLFVDVFFWLSAFLASYQLLVKMRLNDGQLPSNKFALIFGRFFRLWPLYVFTLLFFWRVVPIFGGEGPLFFEYENMNECNEHWLWHLTFINNIVPWSTRDGCMPWTWYLACDMQFFILVPFLVQYYFQNRQRFWVLTVFLWTAASLFSIAVIIKNSLSASYFTYKDEYWTIYYEKPYARLPAYLMGVVWGCSYYSFKHERDEEDQLFAGMTPDQIILRRQQLNLEEEDPGSYQGQKYPKNLLIALFYKLSVNKIGAICVIVFGFMSAVALVAMVTSINAQPIDSKPFLNVIFLMFQRPMFVMAASLAFMPIMLRNPLTYPITAFFEHSFWYPLARLSYGAYLSAGIFMLFRMYNMERGLWACEIDSFFFFMAYLSFAFLFSLLITTLVEKPCHNLFDTFIMGTDREVYLRGPASASRYGKKGQRVHRRNGRSLDDDEESDAETLDKLDDGDEGICDDKSSRSFLTNMATSAYNKGRSDLVLDPEGAPKASSSAKKTSSVSFPKVKPSAAAAMSRQKPAPKKEAPAPPAQSSMKAPLLSSDRSKAPAPSTSGSLNRGGTQQTAKRAESEISEEKTTTNKSSSSPPADDGDGLYFLE